MRRSPRRVRSFAILGVALLPLSIAAADDGWRQALPGRKIELPADHASHPDFKIEWWYYTGNLETPGGERFGYQLTFFRSGVAKEPKSPSRWAVRDLYLAHFAISAIDDESFRSHERFNRKGVAWAGIDADAETKRVRIFNDGWEATIDGDVHVLRAIDGKDAIELRLESKKPPVLHGDAGHSQKGSEEGNASYYYSLTRLETRGTLTWGGRTVNVRGTSWMDHEFGTSFLEADQVGWDWLSIQLDDGRELMLFRLRRRDGSLHERSSGTWIERDGRTRAVRFGDFTFEPKGPTWTSPATGARYPIAFEVRIPTLELALDIAAAFPAQELAKLEKTGIDYWEGAIRATGVRRGERVEGRGYLEMTGYAGKRMGEILR